MQNNSSESPALWTQFCRHPNLKDRETTTWFCGTCSACCGDYFGGRGHCVEMIVGEEKKKTVEQNWSHFALLGSVVERGSRPAGTCDTDRGPRRISAYYISWSGKHANNKCMSNVLVFFAWLIMPFNSRSTTPLHRIISQWSWLFLLSHALSPFFFFFFFLIAKWIMDPAIFTRGRVASWRMGWPIKSIRSRHTNGQSLLLLKTTSPFGLKKIKRWSVRRQNNLPHLCFSVFSVLLH